MAEASDQSVANFLSNWIDANVTHSVEPVVDTVDGLCRRFLTDAVAAGHSLDEVNEHWSDVGAEIKRALRATIRA